MNVLLILVRNGIMLGKGNSLLFLCFKATPTSEQPEVQVKVKSPVKKAPPDSPSSSEDSEEEEDYRHLEGFTRSAAGIEVLYNFGIIYCYMHVWLRATVRTHA